MSRKKEKLNPPMGDGHRGQGVKEWYSNKNLKI